MKLWSLAMKLFNETVQAAANRTWIDPVVMEQILDRSLDEKIVEPAQVVLIEGYRVNSVVSNLGKGHLDRVFGSSQCKFVLCAAVACEHVAEIRTTPLLTDFI